MGGDKLVADVIENIGLKIPISKSLFKPPFSRNDKKIFMRDIRFISMRNIRINSDAMMF